MAENTGDKKHVNPMASVNTDLPKEGHATENSSMQNTHIEKAQSAQAIFCPECKAPSSSLKLCNECTIWSMLFGDARF